MTSLLLFLCFLPPVQDTSHPSYKAVYRTQIITTAPLSFKEQSAINPKDSFLSSLTNDILNDISRKGLRFSYQDSIIVYKDSAVIWTKSLADETTPGINMHISITDSLVSYDKRKRFALHAGEVVQSFPEDSYIMFYATGRKAMVKGYQTEIYISADLSQTIWVTEKLPSFLNPKVRIKNPKGAVLKFRWKDGRNLITGEIERLEKINLRKQSIRKPA